MSGNNVSDGSVNAFMASAVGAAVLSRVASPAWRLLTLAPLRPASHPRDVDSVSPEWLTQVLQNSGDIGQDVCVDTIKTRRFTAGTTCDSACLTLTYRASRGIEKVVASPGSVVIKMARTDLEGQMMNQVLGLWRECQFYKEMAPELPSEIYVPKCYYADVSGASKAFTLVMGDATIVDGKKVDAKMLSPPESMQYYNGKWPDRRLDISVVPQGDDLNGQVDTDMIEGILRNLAKMHAKFWRKPELRAKKWMHMVDPMTFGVSGKFGRETFVKTTAAVEKNYPDFAFRGKPDLMKKNIADALDLIWDCDLTWKMNEVYGFTMTHGDFHGQNMLQTGTTPESICYLDWQLAGCGEPLKDVAYMMTACNTSYYRKIHEERLIKVYWEALIAAGVSSDAFPFELAWARYKYWGGAQWSSVIALLAALKVWDSPEEKKKSEYIYCMLTDLMIAFIEQHGGVRENHEKCMQMVNQRFAAGIPRSLSLTTPTLSVLTVGVFLWVLRSYKMKRQSAITVM